MALLNQVPSYDFFHPAIGDYIARRGGRAARWVEHYRQSAAANIEAWSSQALLLLRDRRIEEARSELRNIEQALPALFEVELSVGYIASRWFFSVTAYLHYLEEDLTKAEVHLEQAEDSVKKAIYNDDFLLPFAHHCTDFHLQKARLARDRQQWITMRDHLDMVRGMNEGTTPLCVLGNGQEVFLSQVTDYYKQLDLDEHDHEILRSLLDTELRLFMTTRAIRMFYTRLGPVVIR